MVFLYIQLISIQSCATAVSSHAQNAAQKEQTHLRLRCHSAAYIKYLLYVSKGHIVGCNNRWLYPDASDSDMSTINRIVFYGDIVRKFKNLFYLDIKSTYYQPKFLRIRLQYVLQTDRNIRTRFEL
eukprot:140284_1